MKMNFDHLIQQGLVKEKKYPNGLRVLKYARKVFYDNLWHVDPLLLEARGIVLDSEDNIVSWPFTKVFNHGENGTMAHGDQLVDVVRKVNGFMAAVTVYHDELLVSTTGSLDSEFVELARKHIEKLEWDGIFRFAWGQHMTFIFEICDATDPHIVAEEEGAYLIGARRLSDGVMATELQVDDIAAYIGAKRPEVQQMLFCQAEELVWKVEHEGFMIRDAFTGKTIMKIKSPHYLTKKALMRVGHRQIEVMFANPTLFRERLDEEFYGVFEVILSKGKDFWQRLEEHERRAFLEEYFKQEG